MTDADWRRACIVHYGQWCRCCGYSGPRIQVDHIKPRSRGGENHVLNGLILCDPWASGRHLAIGGCHTAVTDGLIKRRLEWLDPEQLQYLDEEGWVGRLPNGDLVGEGRGYFTD